MWNMSTGGLFFFLPLPFLEYMLFKLHHRCSQQIPLLCLFQRAYSKPQISRDFYLNRADFYPFSFFLSKDMNESVSAAGMEPLGVSISDIEILKVDMLEGSEEVSNECRGPKLVTRGGTVEVSGRRPALDSRLTFNFSVTTLFSSDSKIVRIFWLECACI